MISIITPTHNTKYLVELYDSIKEQTYTEWEWILVPNNGALNAIPEDILSNRRVRVCPFETQGEIRVGALKRFAASQAQGEILAEVDHDDILVENCLQRIAETFGEHPEAGMVYSNCVQVKDTWEPYYYGPTYGWEYRDFHWKGRSLVETISPEPLPQNLSRIWYAPNHIRAWRKSAYEAIGGYNGEMKVADDHDLICRTFLSSVIVHINEPLYIYRVHDSNTWQQNVAEVQETMWENYTRYAAMMGLKWTVENGLMALDLCGGMDKPQGFLSLDKMNGDILADLEKPWPIGTGTVGIIRAYDALEHMADPVHVMNEAHRVLVHGGFIFSLTPSTKGEGAWCDPTHKSFWNKRSFRYYADRSIRRYIEPACTARFQSVRVRDINRWDDQIPYVEADLIAIKQAEPRFHGELLI